MLLLPQLQELNTHCSVLQGLLPHVVSLIQQGKEVPSGFSLLESYLLIGGPSVLAPVRGEIASVLQQTAERVLVAMSPREHTLHGGCALASVYSAAAQLKALLASPAVLWHGLLQRQIAASQPLALLLSKCCMLYIAALSQDDVEAVLHSTCSIQSQSAAALSHVMSDHGS